MPVMPHFASECLENLEIKLVQNKINWPKEENGWFCRSVNYNKITNEYNDPRWTCRLKKDENYQGHMTDCSDSRYQRGGNIYEIVEDKSIGHKRRRLLTASLSRSS